MAKTSVSTGTPIPQLMLGGAIMMEISIVMIVLSRVLRYKVNRWANIITSIITIVFVVGAGGSYPHYIFVAKVELICLLSIIWVAWKWTNPETLVPADEVARTSASAGAPIPQPMSGRK